MAADADHQGLKRPPGGLGRRHRAPERLDELAGAQDPLIAQVGLPAPPETLDHRPAPEAAQEAAPLEVGPAAPGDAVGDEGPVGMPGPAAGAEVAEDRLGRLPGAGDRPQEGAVPGPGIPIQFAEVRDDLRAQRIEVEIPDEFQEVRVLLHYDGLVPVLEEVAHPLVAAVEGPGIAREQTPHAPGQGARARPHEEVGVVREHGPGVDGPGPALRQGREARDKIRPIPVIPEDDPALQPPHHHVVEGVRRIETGLAGHGRREPSTRSVGTQRPPFRPPFRGVGRRTCGRNFRKQCPRLRLRCSLTTCRDLSGESPDDGRFPVRPSSLTPSTARRRPVPKAGVTRYLSRRGVGRSCTAL